tara:strand:- start:289 stop:600 length:312 start_codon:yes stop_codon:yes gene_type:complete
MKESIKNRLLGLMGINELVQYNVNKENQPEKPSKKKTSKKKTSKKKTSKKKDTNKAAEKAAEKAAAKAAAADRLHAKVIAFQAGKEVAKSLPTPEVEAPNKVI